MKRYLLEIVAFGLALPMMLAFYFRGEVNFSLGYLLSLMIALLIVLITGGVCLWTTRLSKKLKKSIMIEFVVIGIILSLNYAGMEFGYYLAIYDVKKLKYIAEETVPLLEEFKIKHGFYPNNLSLINAKHLKDGLYYYSNGTYYCFEVTTGRSSIVPIAQYLDSINRKWHSDLELTPMFNTINESHTSGMPPTNE